MSEYTRLEYYVATLMGKLPKVKSVLKRAYQRCNYIIHSKNYKYKSSFIIEQISKSDDENFFGYYDKCPENTKGIILYNELKICKDNANKKKLNVVIQSGEEIIYKTPSHAWNYQQGCRAHWLSDDKFVYNDFCFEKMRLIAKVVNISEGFSTITYDYPVQDSYNDTFYVSLNYHKLTELTPEYGYQDCYMHPETKLNAYDIDGIHICSYLTHKLIGFVSLAEIIELGSDECQSHNASHLVNHVMISPNGQKCIFIHRFFLNGRRYDRLILLDIYSMQLSILADNEMVSHCCWADDSTVIGFLRGNNGENRYWTINLETKEQASLEIEDKLSFSDGHPSVTKEWMITDTYPNKARYQKLILLNRITNDATVLGEFLSNLKFSGGLRCDLHPRFSTTGNNIFFDSTFSGKRKLYRLNFG
jgi:hypothetical protein